MNAWDAKDKAAALVAELKNARIDNGCDGVKIAHRAGLQRYVVQSAEAGITNPRLTTLIRWADALEYDVRLVKRGP